MTASGSLAYMHGLSRALTTAHPEPVAKENEIERRRLSKAIIWWKPSLMLIGDSL